MVNSFLTLLVERGAAWGAVWLTLLSFAAWSGWRGRNGGIARIAALTALAGGAVSGALSTCIDLSVLSRGSALGFTPMQVGMAWLLLAAFAAPLAWLWIMGWRGGLSRPGRAFVAAAVASLAFVAGLAVAGRILGDGRAPAVVWSDGLPFARIRATRPGGESAILLYDDGADLPAMVGWARQWMPGREIYLPLSAWHFRTELPALPADRVVLRGKCGHLADRTAGRPATLISPPADLPRPASADRLFLRKYAERPPWPLADDDPLRVEHY